MLTSTYRTPAPVPFGILNRMLAEAARPSWGGFAYDLVRTGDDSFRLELPVVGLGEAELEIEAKGDVLTVRGRPAPYAEGETVLHAGLRREPFVRSFTLADHLRVTGARLERGLLLIDLAREVPEALRPRTIAING